MINEAYTVKNYLKKSSLPNQKCNLSLFLSTNSLLFIEFGEDFKSIIELSDIEFNTSNNLSLTLIERLEFLFSNYQLIKNYNKVYISILNSHFTLIPNAYKNQNNTSDILKFGTGLTTAVSVIEHSITNLAFCYALPLELKQLLEKTFPIAFIRHSGAVILNLFNTLPALINFDLFLNINYKIIEIAVKQKNDLQFYNVFNYQTNEDIIYYLLFTLEQLNLNPITVKVVIAGQIETEGNLISSIKKYIKFLNFFSNTTPAFTSTNAHQNELDKLPPHYYFSVLNQHLCEL